MKSCDKEVPANNKWARIHAHAEGWYFMKDGRSFCPRHRPSWAPKRVKCIPEEAG